MSIPERGAERPRPPDERIRRAARGGRRLGPRRRERPARRRLLAVEFARRGCHVLATARSLHAIEDLPGLCVSDGLVGEIQTARVDVCDQQTLVEAIAAFGPVDIAVANAGMSGFAPLIEQPLDTFAQVNTLTLSLSLLLSL